MHQRVAWHNNRTVYYNEYVVVHNNTTFDRVMLGQQKVLMTVACMVVYKGKYTYMTSQHDDVYAIYSMYGCVVYNEYL